MPMSTVGNSIRADRNGFTLFELIVVIALLGIMAGLVVPNISLDVGGSGPESVVHDVQGVMDQARTHARLTRGELTVVFEPDSMRIRPEGGAYNFPANTNFEGLVLLDQEDYSGNELIVDERGVVPSSIVRIKVDGQIYSLLLSPVLRRIDYKEGLVDFANF